MIYGIIAASTLSQPTISIASLGSFDFVNGEYSWNGITLAASDVVDQTGWIGASGLAIPGSSGAGAELLYAAMTTVLAGCNFTAVVEIETINTNKAIVFSIANSGDAYYVDLAAHAEADYYIEDYGGTYRYAEDYEHALSVGVHKIATTTAPDRTSISIDGNAIVTDPTASTVPVGGFPMTKFYLGGWSNNTQAAVNIRSFAIYETKDDANLPLLSI